jgi:hypothetical protein
VLVGEVGYAPVAAAPVRPWEEDGAPDPAAQLACYRAFVDAARDADWLAGALWWKWFSSGAAGPDDGPSFSPRARPAETVMRESLKGWRTRAVRVPPPRP